MAMNRVRYIGKRNEQTIDKETHQILVGYALKLVEMFRRRPNSQVTEFLIRLLTLPERRLLDRRLQKETLLRSGRAEGAALQSLKQELSDLHGYIAAEPENYASGVNRKIFSKQPSLHLWFMNEIQSALLKKVSRSGKAVNRPRREASLLSRLEEIGGVFGLTEKEQQILLFLHLRETNDLVERVFETSDLRMDVLLKSIKYYCRFFDVTPIELRDMLKKDSTLVGAGLITKSRHQNSIEIPTHVVSYLAGIATKELTDSFFDPDRTDASIALSDFSISAANVEVMRALLESEAPTAGRNILLYGAPGTGKTEFARAMVRTLGAEVFFIKQTDEEGDENLSHRKTALVAAQNLLKKRNCVLIVDECDPIINTKSGIFLCDFKDKNDEKSWINHYLEKSNLRVIWISNQTRGIDDSTKRRFSYAQEFLMPDKRQRQRAWEIQVKQNGTRFLDQKIIEKLALQYNVSPGTIALALRDVEEMGASVSEEAKLGRLRNILQQKQAFCSEKKNGLARIVSSYDLEGLNTDIPLQEVQDTVGKFYRRVQAVGAEMEVRNLNLLLLGPPGTGKTEFVKHLADRVEKELMIKRTSDLLSKWIGESEQNIARAFEEAEQRDALLFLDEADSLFISREGATRSWEVSQTNELLCQMENFKGVLVCATNFSKHLDKAVLRRFGYKVKFDNLRPEANLVFFNRILGPLLSRALNPSEEAQIAGIASLAPGDFKVVYQKHFLNERADPAALIRDLHAEVESKRSTDVRPILGLGG